MAESPTLPKRRRTSLTDRLEKPVEVLIRVCGWSSIAVLTAILIFILKEAGPMLTKLDWGHFFTSTRWIPHPGSGNEASFGAWALIVGTFSTTGIALCISVPFGLAAAVYISEYATGRKKEWMKVLIELLAAVPSIVWGFIGLMVLGPFIQSTTGAPQGTNLLNGASFWD